MEDFAQNIKLEFGVLCIALKIMPSRYLLKDTTSFFVVSFSEEGYICSSG